MHNCSGDVVVTAPLCGDASRAPTCGIDYFSSVSTCHAQRGAGAPAYAAPIGNSYASKGSIPRADLYGTPASGPTDGTSFSGFWSSKHMNCETCTCTPWWMGRPM